ncbi:DDE endonuclease [Pasteurellaceae bacterium HPA106]|uniref:transposase domain-containing protein n=1 Tax=Spirabiliibacterium pneumoniae TaxID=221400 RepID=UPI001AAE0F6B|nr:transposase domain-containing protein [Spirabiliibacterium pneumoniae]MBE2896766.1 DDE endonuclease [Spirabiliibacterium pneumoniae]
MRKKMLKTFYSSTEIANLKLKNAPHSAKNVIEKAKREGWEYRKRLGRGGGLEYSLISMPQLLQNEIIFAQTQKVMQKVADHAQQNNPQQINYLPEVVWAPFDKANDRQKAVAQSRLVLVSAVADLVDNGLKLMDAIAYVANQHGETVGTIKRWFYKVKKFERTDWLPLLLDKKATAHKGKEAEFTPEAWEAFKTDYFRNERPQFGSCYERLKRAAKEQGWTIPSASSVKRKIEREIPLVQRVFLRDGEYALSQFYPSQVRSVEAIQALEWINGDGYQHNVFVRWHNGEVVRPKTWLWQDVRTRKILAYRTDLSENSDTIRLSLMDLVWKYGIPRKCTIDNTRAAANKWMTGGVKNRYRFKVKEDEVTGIIPLLGIELFWTSIQFGKGHGQAKPIERAFSHGGLGELVDKHPSLAGFYAGENVYNKPDNYNGGKDGVDYATFILALEDGIRTFNERQGRETEICQGVYSFEQVFARDYANATIRRASAEQMRLLMLMSEAVSLKKDGTFELDAGGKVHNRRNRYLCADLIGSLHKRVVVKFDPQDLHNTVWVYSLDGVFLGEAICQERVAFGDKAAGREHDKARKQFVKGEKIKAKAQLTMTVQEAARYQPELDEQDPPEPKIIELIQTYGNTQKKVQVPLDEDEESEFEQNWAKGLALLKQEKGL